MKAIIEMVDNIGLLQTVRAFKPAAYNEIVAQAEKFGPLRHLNEHRYADGEMFYSHSEQVGPFFTGPIGEKWLKAQFGVNSWANPGTQLWVSYEWTDYDPRECSFRGEQECDCGEDENGDWIDCAACNFGSDYCDYHSTYH